MSEQELWNRYQTELRDIYTNKAKPIYPLFHLIKKYYSNSNPLSKICCEIGFGDGGLLRSLATLFANCYGLDISNKNVELTSSQFKLGKVDNVVFEVFNILDIPKYIDFFDAIILSHVLEHFEYNEIAIILSNVKTMLKKGGIFFGATPYKKPLNKRICPGCGTIFEIDGHKQIFDEHSMKNILIKNGFKIEMIRKFNADHFYYGETTFFKIIHRLIFKKDLTTQLEFIARPE